MMENIPVEIEIKLVIEMPDFSVISKMEGYTKSRITQTYLSSPAHITHRVRKREYPDRVVYTETKKVRIDKMSSYEDEREISAEEYSELLLRQAPDTTPVEKTRHTVRYCGRTVEIDAYPAWKRSCILEVELPSRDTEYALPECIRVIRDVTGDKRYSNAAMSRAFPEELV